MIRGVVGVEEVNQRNHVANQENPGKNPALNAGELAADTVRTSII
jgi:hypothetical protein